MLEKAAEASASWLKALIDAVMLAYRPIASFLDWARKVLAPLSDLRIIIGLLVAGGFIVLFLEPGRDVVAGLVDNANATLGENNLGKNADSSFFQWSFFWAACVWTGLNAWYWAHILYKTEHGATPPKWFTVFRAILGVFPLACAIAAMFLVSLGVPDDIWFGASVFGITIPLMLLFFARQPVTALLVRRGIISSKAADAAPVEPVEGPQPLLSIDKWLVGVSLIFSAIMLILFTIPVLRTMVAWAAGPAAVAFVAIGCIIPASSVLIWWARSVRFPIFTAFVLGAVLFSAWNDNHDVRRLPGELADRPDLDTAIKRWKEAHTPEDPIVLIATAGGASRAAYWTGTVLRALEDGTGGRGFAHNVFAISSVSGGTLAAVGYAAWVSDRQASRHLRTTPRERLQFVRDYFGADYLSPAIAGLMFPDLIQRFTPLSLWPSRADSLEEAWETAWRQSAEECVRSMSGAAARTCPNPERMASDFLEIWPDLSSKVPPQPRGWVPLVLVNGTHVQTGKRIITAPVAVPSAAFEDSYDFFKLFEKPIRASTAISNSARFPVISPAGTIDDKGHIIDGGYFENGGLETLIDLARYIRAKEPERRIVIIEINNNDRLGEGDSARCNRTNSEICGLPVDQPAGEDGSPILGELTAIFGGLYRTRDGRGVLGAKRASIADGIGNVRFVQFKLNKMLGRQTTMSWSLSLTSRDYMDVVFGATDQQIEEVLEGRNYRKARRERVVGRLKEVSRSPLSKCYRHTLSVVLAELAGEKPADGESAKAADGCLEEALLTAEA